MGLLLWSALLPLLLLSQRLSQRLMLIQLFSMELTDMAVLNMDMVLDTEPMDMPDIHMSMERDLPMLSQRLMLLSPMELTDMLDTHMLDTLMDTHMPMVPMDT